MLQSRITRALPVTTMLLCLLKLTACASPFDMPTQPESAKPVGQPIVTIKPEIDYSSEKPDCVLAGQRLAENVKVGMPLEEVIRLVGKPVYKLPGSWWWSGGFSKTGKPVVRYDAIGTSLEEAVVTKISSETNSC